MDTRSEQTEIPIGAAALLKRQGRIPQSSDVYFVLASESGLVKIGHAKSAWKRPSSLQVGSAEELLMLGIVPTLEPRELERDPHRRFAADRVRGEWFSCTDALVAYVKRHAREPWALD